MAGVALHFNDEGVGRAVLIMHGLFGSSTNFRASPGDSRGAAG
ncbi:MAG: hypothetical protein M5U09_07965 [Gammaproteobacteria bacterium]|nr:hypothetical protein [Gammaproteobacteria bacterium]